MEIDIIKLAHDLSVLISPYLPFFLSLSEKAAEEAAKRVGADAWENLKSIWGRLKPKVESDVAAKKAVENSAKDPADDQTLSALRSQLEKLLREDGSLAREVFHLVHNKSMVVSQKQQVAQNQNVSVIVNIDSSTSGRSDAKPEGVTNGSHEAHPSLSSEDIRRISQDRLYQVLNRGEFSQKYINHTYVHRGEAEDLFNRFIRRRDRICFVVTGLAGKGKTNLFCHLAEQSIKPAAATITVPVLLNSAKLDLEKCSLADSIILHTFDREKGLHVPGDFYEFCERLAQENATLIVFIDAINELSGQNAFGRFNEQFNRLVEEIRLKGYPVLFCLSCRSEFWPNFLDAQWARNEVFNARIDAPTIQLADFSLDEIDQIIARYFDYYRIKGKLLGDARKRCADPIMLRYLCTAYTKRKTTEEKNKPNEEIEWTDIRVIRTLRRKEVFDRFVEEKRRAIYEKAGSVLGVPHTGVLYKTTSQYLLAMANVMYQNRRPYITVEEVEQIAADLGHPDIQLFQAGKDVTKEAGSILFQFIDEGIILDKRSEGVYEFVFETYFEYSLGRYIALERWPNLAGRKNVVDPEAIEADFAELLHDNFPNLFGAMQFAILTIETDARYRDHSDLFIHLIKRMSQTKKLSFDWIQQALATIRETGLADPGTWETLEKASRQERNHAINQFRLLLDVLNESTSTSDFVILWDVENTIQRLASANLELTLARVRHWALGQGLQPVFAAQALTQLGNINPPRIIEELAALSAEDRYRCDFWLARSLISAAASLVRRDFMGEAEIILTEQDWDRLQEIVRKFADPACPETIRSLALASLPFLSRGDPELLAWITSRMKEEGSAWAWWNLAYGLQAWPPQWSRSREWVFEILEQAMQHPSAHVTYAAARAVVQGGNLYNQNPAAAEKLQPLMEGKPWQTTLVPGRLNYQLANLTGIVYFPAFLEPAYDNHIECRERVQAVISKLDKAASGHINWITPRAATEEQIRWVHNRKTDRHRNRASWPTYVDDIKETTKLLEQSGRDVGPATGPIELRAESYEAALLSAGAVLQAVDYVLAGPAVSAWAINRPPGHLANNVICVFNNIALGAVYARRIYGKKRILIIDCDAHHGKHTNQVFLADPNVLYFSLHIEGGYAQEDGMVHHTGEGEGEGYTFNLPYPAYMGDEGYKYMIDELLVPVALEFKPELILLSAGFDGHFADYFTPGCILTERAYMHLAKKIRLLLTEMMKLGINAKLVATLEGGYGLQALANSLVHMMNIVGEWCVEEDSIGFVPVPSDLRQDDTEAAVKRLVQTRVQLMETLKTEKPDYIFDLNQSHWQEILQEQLRDL